MGCIFSQRTHLVNSFKWACESGEVEKYSASSFSLFHPWFSRWIFKLCMQKGQLGEHKAKSVKDYVDAAGIGLFESPAESLDLNTIENSWALLKRWLLQRTTYLTNPDNLFDALFEEWNLTADSFSGNLIRSLSSRVFLVRKRSGRSTTYQLYRKVDFSINLGYFTLLLTRTHDSCAQPVLYFW